MLSSLNSNVSFTNVDLEEPSSAHLTIISYKATQARLRSNNIPVVVEDSALFIEGSEDVSGVNIKWILDHLNDYHTKRATFVVLIGYSDGQHVNIFEGRIPGRIQIASTDSNTFGFDNHFIPDGSNVPYSVSKPFHLNPRYLALQKLVSGTPDHISDCINVWSGKFQS